MDEFGDLLKTDLGLASCDNRGNRFPRRRPANLARFARHGIRDAKLLEAHGREICAAAAVRICDRLGVEQRLAQCLDCADVRFGLPRAHDHPDERLRERHLAVGADQIPFNQEGGPRAIHDRDVRILSARQTCRDRLRRIADRRTAGGDKAMPAPLFELRAEL